MSTEQHVEVDMTAIVLAALFALGDPSSPAPPGPAKRATAEPSPSGSRWRLDVVGDEAKGDATYMLQTSAEAGKQALVILCSKGAGVMIDWGGFLSLMDVSVKMKLDDGDAETETWRLAGERQSGIVYPIAGGEAFARRLATAKRLTVDVSPRGGTPPPAPFNLEGLAEQMPKLKGCSLP